MAGPVSGVNCNNPYVCQPDGVTRDEPQALPPVMLGSGGGVGDGNEPPSLQTQQNQRAMCISRKVFIILSGFVVSAKAVAVGNLVTEVWEKKLMKGAQIFGFSGAVFGAIGLGFVCSYEPPGPGNPPSGGTPTGGSEEVKPPVVYSEPGGRTKVRIALEPSPWLVPAGLAALLGAVLLKNPQAGAAVLQGAGVMVAPETDWVPAGSYPEGAL